MSFDFLIFGNRRYYTW